MELRVASEPRSVEVWPPMETRSTAPYSNSKLSLSCVCDTEFGESARSLDQNKDRPLYKKDRKQKTQEKMVICSHPTKPQCSATRLLPSY